MTVSRSKENKKMLIETNKEEKINLQELISGESIFLALT